MAAFDLNSLYFLKNAAPKAASFEELNAPTERGFNLGRAYNENYNRNSLQNLIAQREKEGVPYDRLSNEAAKWDLGAAQAMRNERRSSLEYNYKQSVAEFEQWRRNMARRICGLILQKADELGIAPEELDRVLNVAASYVVTYDEALAQWLLGHAMARRNALTRANNQKPLNDHEIKISDLTRINPKPDENPADFAEMTGQQHAAQAILRYKNATGNNIWLRQVQYLLNYAKQKFPKYIYGAGSLDEMRAWLDDLTPQEIADIINKIEGDGDVKSDVPEINNNSGNTASNQDDTPVAPELITRDSGTKKKKINDNAVAAMQSFIDANEYNVSALRDARKKLQRGMSWAEGQSGGSENTALKNMLDNVDKLIAHNVEMGAESPTAFKRAFDKMLGSQRTATSLNAMMTAFHNAVSAADKSTSPLTLLNSILLAQLPFYKATDYDAKAALKIKGAGTWNDLKSVVSQMGIPFFSQIAAYDTIDQAIDAALMDLTNTFNGMYYNWMADAKSDEERKQIISGVRSRWNLNDRDLEILKDGKLPIGEIRQRLREKAVKDYGKTYVDKDGNTIDSSTGKIIKQAGSNSTDGEINMDEFQKVFNRLNGGGN